MSISSLRLPYLTAATCCLLALPGCMNDTVPSTGHLGQESDSMDTNETANSDTGSDTGSDTDSASEPNPRLITPRFEPESADFFRMPWPSDHRVFDDGTVDLRDFPNAEQGLIARTRATIEHNITGFSTAPVIYTQLDRNPGMSALIEPKHTLDPSAPIQLVDVSPEGCGRRIPLLLQYDAEGDELVAPGVLEASVVEGFTLDPNTPYAFVMLKTFGRQSGFDTARPEAFDAALQDDPENPLTASLEPLWACAETAGLYANEIAIATVFTTQDPTDELERVSAFVRDPEQVASPPLLADKPHAFAPERTIEGQFQVPMFMRGESPYVNGGGFEFDTHGTPVIQRWEEVPFLFVRPKGEGPFPVVLWLDGTGQEEWGFLNHLYTQDLLDQGVAVLSFSPQFHGSRATQGSDSSSSTFNLLNPESLRSVLRQQATEASYATRLLRETLAGHDVLQGVDTSRIMYAGHSQGALVGAMVAGVDPNFRAYLLSGGASHLSTTLVSRDGGELEAVLRSLIGVGRELDRFHPAIQLAQLAGDVVDPHNYAHQWSGTLERPEGANVLMIEGLHDHTTAPEGMGFFVIAGDAAPLEPAGWNVDPFGVWERQPEASPIQGNRKSLSGSSHTVAALLDANQGHYTLYDNPAAHKTSLAFLLSAATGTPKIVYTSEY